MTYLELEHHFTVDGAAYDVLHLSAREALDEIGSLECDITDHEGGPAPKGLVGKSALLTLSRKDGAGERKFAGYVIHAEHTTTRGAEENFSRVVVRPRLHRLTQRQDCRVFQDKSAPDIAKEVLEGAGIPTGDQQWMLGGTYPKRKYTSQYRETDFDFVRRLLAEEGIAFFVDSSSGKDIVVLFDGPAEAVEGAKELVFRAAEGLLGTHDAITALSQETNTAPGCVVLRDYDFERPRLKMESKAEGDDDAEKSLEVYVYPGRFTEPSLGDRYAKVLLESLRARREVVSGVTNALRVCPGRRFDLAEHPYEPMNREYFVIGTEIELEARRGTNRRANEKGGGHHFTFRAIPTEKTTYRPPRVRPVAIPGAQVAVTTGAAGKEIHPDKHGRVKVQFPWDRKGKSDDSSSCWIRTTQMPLGGGMLTPRVGWETCVDFVEGDPDQPLVAGRLYNAASMPPYSLPENKTRMALQTATTPGGGSTNEIRMEDKAGGEEMFMNASKDARFSAGNNATESVTKNETRKVGSNQSLAVTDSMTAHVGADQSLTVGSNQKVNVETYMVDEIEGNHELTVGGNRDLKAGGDHKRTVTGASTLSVGGMQIDLVAGSVDEESLATMNDKVGAALVELTVADRTVTVTGNRTEKAGLAKAVVTKAGRAVNIGGTFKQKVGGGILNKVKGDRSDTSATNFIELATGAQIVKARNVMFEAESLLSVVMGASTITLTPHSVSIAGTNITLQGDCAETGLIKDN